MLSPVSSDVHAAPDGSSVRFTCSASLKPSAWTWNLRVTTRTSAVGMTITTLAELDREPRPDVPPVAELVYVGRQLHLRRAREGESWIATWRGPHHSLSVAISYRPDLSTVVSLLDELNIADAPQGLRLRPKPGSGATVWNLQGWRYVAGVGPATIYPRREAGGLVPPIPGTTVGDASLWRIALEAPGVNRGQKYLHAGPTAVTTLDDAIGADPRASAEGVEEFLRTLRVDWMSPSR